MRPCRPGQHIILRTPGSGQRLTIFWSGNVKQRSRSGNGSAKRRLSGASERLPLAADMPSVGSAGDQYSSVRNEGPNHVGIYLCRSEERREGKECVITCRVRG